HFIYLMCRRISDVSHQMLLLLQCFDYEWLTKKDTAVQALRKRGQDEEDVKQEFVFPNYKRLLKELFQIVGEKELGILKWLARTLHQIDKILSISPHDLDRILMVSSWHTENGVLRDWLRDIFPRLQDHPKTPKQEFHVDKTSSCIQGISSLFINSSSYDQLGTGLAQFLSRQDVKIKDCTTLEPPTLMDIEFFLLILFIQRHYYCVTDGEAETIGQILYLEAKDFWKPSESHRRFWQTLLHLYGKVDRDKRVYTGDILSNDEFFQCLSEIRGEFNMQDYDYDEDQIQFIPLEEISEADDLIEQLSSIFIDNGNGSIQQLDQTMQQWDTFDDYVSFLDEKPNDNIPASLTKDQKSDELPPEKKNQVVTIDLSIDEDSTLLIDESEESVLSGEEFDEDFFTPSMTTSGENIVKPESPDSRDIQDDAELDDVADLQEDSLESSDDAAENDVNLSNDEDLILIGKGMNMSSEPTSAGDSSFINVEQSLEDWDVSIIKQAEDQAATVPDSADA
ncbi:9109_t:CDS:2, partial [Acaulospora colombiana]